jgi:cobalt/nickel transport system permease protein
MLELLLVLSYLVSAALARDWLELGLLALMAVPFLTKLRARKLLLAVPFLLVALPWLYLTPGPVWAWHITVPGLHKFGLIAARGLLSLTALIWLTESAPFSKLLEGLRRLGCPAVLTALMGLVYRYLFVIKDEARRLMVARKCRAVGSPGLFFQARTAGAMVGNLFLRSLERSERLYAAMRSRGFTGAFPCEPPARLETAHVLGLGLWVGALAGVLWFA